MHSPTDKEHSPSSFREQVLHWFGPAFAVVALLAALVLLYFELKDHSWQEIVAALKALPARNVALAILLTAVNYTILSGYDALAIWYLRRPLKLSQLMFGAFVSYAMSHNFTWMLGGTATRFRLYTAWGFTPVQVVKLFALIGLTFWTGFCALAGIVFLTQPMPIPKQLHAPLETTFWLGPVLLGILSLYLIGCAIGKPISVLRWRIEFPPLRLALMQGLVASCDLLLYAAVMYVLMPPGVDIGYWRFANVVLLALGVAIISHVPGGVVVLEVAVLELVPHDDPTAIFGSLLAFRAIFYLLPLIVAVAMLGGRELFVHRDKAKARAQRSSGA
jgi:uncharacterized membrane protein YbhN (UPF0104 family)